MIHLRNPSYIYKNRLGVYCFQRRVPEALRTETVPAFVRFSLKTKHLQTALKFARKIAVKFDALAQQYFETEDSFLKAVKLLQEDNEVFKNSPSLEFYELNTKLDTTGGLKRDEHALLNRLLSYLEAKKIGDGLGSEDIEQYQDFKQYFDKQTSLLAAKIENQATAHLIPKFLAEAIDAYIAEKKLKWKNDGASEKTYRDVIFKLFLDLTGNIKTTELTKEHSNQYKALILNLPTNRNKSRKYRHLTVNELVSATVDDADKLDLRTQTRYLNRVSSFLGWLSRSGYAISDLNSPLIGVIAKKTQLSVDDKLPYTKDDLRKLFNSEAYTRCKHLHAYRYWTPLIALLTGARENEICQLFISDIVQDEETGIWLFDINENDASLTFKSLKRPYHNRKVPIHHELIKLGFLEYVEYLKKAGHERVFPELKYNGERNKYATDLTKWFNRTYTNKVNCNITTPKTSFHSFRHNVINYFAHELDIAASKFAYVIGQKPEGNIAVTTYIKASELKVFASWYKKLDFSDCIDFKQIANWKRFPFARQ